MDSAPEPPAPAPQPPQPAMAPAERQAPQAAPAVVIPIPPPDSQVKAGTDPVLDGPTIVEPAPEGKVRFVVTEDIPAYGSKKMFVTMLMAMLFVWFFGWLYIGSAWNPQARLKHLKVAVLNCDRGVAASVQKQLPAALAPVATRLAQQPLGLTVLSRSIWNASSPVSRILSWRNYSCPPPSPGAPGCAPDAEAACLAHLRDHVLQGRAFAALYIDGNISTTFLTTVFGTNTSAQLTAPTQLTYIRASARQVSTYGYITTTITSLVNQASYALGATFLADPAAAKAMNPYWFLRPLALRTIDLAPVLHFGQYFSTYMLMVLTWLASTFTIAVAFDFHMPAEAAMLRGGPPLSRKQALQAVAVRVVVASATTLFATTMLLCVPLILGHSGHIQFVGANAGVAIAFLWYSSWAYMGINALLLHALGPRKFSTFSTLLLILQLSSATAIYAHELSPGFYRIGYGLPFFWSVRGLRAIFFGVMKDSMWLSWLVITAWNVVAWGAAVSLLFLRERGKLRNWLGVADAAMVLKHSQQGSALQQASAGLPLVA